MYEILVFFSVIFLMFISTHRKLNSFEIPLWWEQCGSEHPQLKWSRWPYLWDISLHHKNMAASGVFVLLDVSSFRKIERCSRGWTQWEVFSLTIIPEQIFVYGHKLLETLYKCSFSWDLFLSILPLKFLHKFRTVFTLNQLGTNTDFIFADLLILLWTKLIHHGFFAINIFLRYFISFKWAKSQKLNMCTNSPINYSNMSEPHSVLAWEKKKNNKKNPATVWAVSQK